MIYVVGGTGFVGSAYVRLFTRLGLEHRVVTRTTWEELSGTHCDILVNANGNARKFLADEQPLFDFEQSVRSVAESFEGCSCGTYVFLSSGDVYPDQSSPELTGEGQAINPAHVSRYGQHKLLAEQLVRGRAREWLILRMGGFVGPGLKKNAVFDMLHNAPVWLAPDSEFQFISTDRAAEIVWNLIDHGVTGEVINLGAVGLVQLGALHKQIGSRSEFKPGAPKIRYELSLAKLKTFYRGTLPNSRNEVSDFVGHWRKDAAGP